MTHDTEKAVLRKKMNSILENLGADKRKKMSRDLCEAFLRDKRFLESKVVFGFMPFGFEVDILPILEASLARGKKVLLPKIMSKRGDMEFFFVKNDLRAETEKNKWGIFEPSASVAADVATLCREQSAREIIVLVPGIAFTRDGIRLGRGGGYYDRFLPRFAKEKAFFVGVCFENQIADCLASEPHDIKMDFLLC